jgi:MFS family permease
VAGAGGAYQLAAAAAFVRALPGPDRAHAFAVALSGLLAAQVLGILAAGAVAQRLGPQAAVALAGLVGLVAAAVLATDWIHRHAEVLALLDATDHQLTGAPDQLAATDHQLTGRPARPRSRHPAGRRPRRRVHSPARPPGHPPGSARHARPARRGPASCRLSS